MASTVEPQPVFLALPGPAFPHINFDPSPTSEECSMSSRSSSSHEGMRFLVGGKPLLLDQHVKIDSMSHTEKTAGSVWDCSLVLAKYLENHSEEFLKGKHVVELGAGQGVVGLACALAGAEMVTLTDVDAAMPSLEANVAVNSLGGHVRVRVVDWMRAKEHVAALDAAADTVVAADTVWVDALAIPFVSALALTLGNDGAKGVLCHRTRTHKTDKVLFDAIRDVGISFQEVPRSEHDGTFRDPDIRLYTLWMGDSEQ